MEPQMIRSATPHGRPVLDSLNQIDENNPIEEVRTITQQGRLSQLDALLAKLAAPEGKKSFLVLKNNRYLNVPTDNIAFFYIKHKSQSCVIICFGKQEYIVNYSLEQVQHLLPQKQFFRLNRQYLVNFNAVKDVERSFARKLVVNPVIPIKDTLLVSKEKVVEFLHWLDNR
jgi:two-component system, LytTR family, response regulator LytT